MDVAPGQLLRCLLMTSQTHKLWFEHLLNTRTDISICLPPSPPPPSHTHSQARRLDIRLRTPKNQGPDQQKLFVHMLNSTLSATERTLCCILENYQTPEGVRVPEALQPFMPGIDFIPFRKALNAKGQVRRLCLSTGN